MKPASALRLAKVTLSLLFVFACFGIGSSARAQFNGPIGSFREIPGPVSSPEPPGAAAAQANIEAAPPSILGNLNISGNYVGRAAVIFDSNQLQSFSLGSFLPSAIPVKGEPFFDSGERATVQGSGSAVQLTATLPTQVGNIKSDFVFLATDVATGNPISAQVSQAVVQVNRLVVGLTDTAFADADAVVPTIDLAGPNGVVTIFGPTGGGGQGRLSYYLYPSGSDYDGWIGNVSIENPVPEVQFTNGPTPLTSFSPFSQIPDFIATIKYADAEKLGGQIHEHRHIQFGTVLREIGVENGNETINDSVFGWGTQLSGATEVFARDCQDYSDSVGFSIVYGQGIGHYIEDLHETTVSLKGGNDAFLNGSTLEPLTALAWYVGYLHFWNDSWQSSVAYSHVDLDNVAGETPSMYRHGSYAMINLVYHIAIPGSGDPLKPNPFKNIFAGVEYLYGQKTELSGSTGSDNRLMFMVNISK